VSILGCCSAPRSVVVEWQALLAVRSVRKVFALTNFLPFAVESRAVNAFVRVTVTFASSSDRDIGNRIEV
jgi:hypothetical protein